MPSFPSQSAPDLRRSRVSQPALFPPCPDMQGPRPSAGGGPAPTASGPGDSIPGSPTADCPPPSFSGAAPNCSESAATHGAQRRADGPTRNAGAPLVGIARLAASSPPAETSRKSEERPEYFLLPVRSIL